MGNKPATPEARFLAVISVERVRWHTERAQAHTCARNLWRLTREDHAASIIRPVYVCRWTSKNLIDSIAIARF